MITYCQTLPSGNRDEMSGPADRSAVTPPEHGIAQQVSWWQYVVSVTGDATQKDIAAATGIDQSSISRWQRGTNKPRAEAVVALARAYGRSPVEGLVAAGYLCSDELGVVELTTLTGDLRNVSIDSLLAEVRRRVISAHVEVTPSWPPGWTTNDAGMDRYQDGEQTRQLDR